MQLLGPNFNLLKKCTFCMHNMVWLFGKSAFHIYHWPKKLVRCFVRHFMYTINMYYIDYVGLVTRSQLFWGFGNHVGNFFWSITQGSIRSIRLWSICNEVYDWPNFFSRSCLWSNRSLTFSLKVDWKPLGQTKIWSTRVLCYCLFTLCFIKEWKLNSLFWRFLKS